MELTDSERTILDFEAMLWTHSGAKEAAIVERFGVLAPRYYQLVNALIDRPESHAYAPLLVRRLQRIREVRRKQRSAG